ncbi:MAG: tetratricopeptide repeat protein [Terracidiphilus sp.]|nr:tetratricopeptide repeat protein [Terracidiphilus sp.]
MTSYSRQDVLRILEIGSRQLQGWERAGLIAPQQSYSFQELGQLRTLRMLREESVPAASIRQSILAMKAVSGMSNPLLEACIVRTGTRLVFRYSGAIVDPIRRQLLFDFERYDRESGRSVSKAPALFRQSGDDSHSVHEMFLKAVEAEETGQKQQATKLYKEILTIDPGYAPAAINMGTLYFHQQDYEQAESLYRHATLADPDYVLAHFDLGNVLDEMGRLDESIEAYEQAVALAPGYADAHYNLALAYERKGQNRPSLRHWQAYLRLDHCGPWAEHARERISKLLESEKLAIAWRTDRFIPRGKGKADLKLA